MKRSRIAALVTLAVIAAGIYYLYRGGSAPAGQAALLRLSSGNFADLKSDFNAAPDVVRLVVMLAPT